jgi:hypothetical protein
VAEWEVETTDEGTFDVFHHRRIVKYDEDTVEDAAREVKRRGGHEFVLVEPDGYRTTHRC